MGWFKRLKDGIQTATRFKKEAPDGLWHKCKSCGETSTIKELKDNFFKCPTCNHHARIGSHDYFDLIFDGQFTIHFENIVSKDPLEFKDLKAYPDRLKVVDYCCDGFWVYWWFNGKCSRGENSKSYRSCP